MERLIAFRVDWSTDIGLGHVQRCLALMEALEGHSFRGIFVVRAGEGMATDLVESRGHTVLTMPHVAAGGRHMEASDARQFRQAVTGLSPQLVVVDHYGLSHEWESTVHALLETPVIAIDGRADRAHSAAIVIDPTFVTDDDRWRGLVDPDAHLLQGVEFTLVAPGFAEAFRRRPERDGTVGRVLVSFGGSDPFDSTALAIEALAAPKLSGLPGDVVIGATHSDPERIRMLCEAAPSLTFHHATSRMAELSGRADLAIGAGGTSMFERAFLGLPALVVIAAENQRRQVESIATTGAVENLGEASNLTVERLASRLHVLVHDPEAVKSMSAASRAMMRHALEPGSTLAAERIAALCR
jgi:UDP-2,4-diacetamido-2,4,6-trideoxy-beta-L-altropyranose hydrolase